MCEDKHYAKISSSELAMLWGTYTGDSLATCVLKHFLETVENPDIKPVIIRALEISESHIAEINRLFIKEEIAIPVAFSSNDVNEKAPRLYSDLFYIRYLQHMARSGLVSYALAQSTSARKDVRSFFSNCISEASMLYNLCADVMLENGFFVRSPLMRYPENTYFVHDKHFVAGYFGKQRALTAMELTHISTNMENLLVAKTLLQGFAQVTTDKTSKARFNGGIKVGDEFYMELREFLDKDGVAIPGSWDSTVTASVIAPFSEKLMMYHVASLISLGITNYGAALSTSMRKDLGLQYAKMITEATRHGERIANIMIENGWFESFPQTNGNKS